MRRERDPTPEEFKKLLAWLGPDEDKAGYQYTLINNRLTRVFGARGCVDSESLSLEVLNRVCVRIDSVVKNYPDPLRCCLGFVDHVYHEYLREERAKAKAVMPPDPRPHEELEREDRCLEQCLDSLDEADQDVIRRYFQGEKRVKIDNRKRLAAELKKTANALRIHAFKKRKEMNECLRNCLAQG